MRKQNKCTLFSLLAILFLLGTTAHAAQITLTPSVSAVAPNTPFTITVSMTTTQNAVNVVQGAVTIPAAMVVEKVSTAGSTFTLWPTTPTYVPAKNQVEFSGGVPGGVAKGKTVQLFSIQVHATKVGAYSVTPNSLQAYQNDGKGTGEPLTVVPASITVKIGAASNTLASTSVTQPLVATVGRDASLHNGDYFVTFSGGDRGDGVVRYEIEEGNGAFILAIGDYYVLTDQTLSKDITVRALDANGVSAQTTIKAQHKAPLSYAWMVIAIVFAAVLAYLIFFRKKKK
jgi:hypothetical protein